MGLDIDNLGPSDFIFKACWSNIICEGRKEVGWLGKNGELRPEQSELHNSFKVVSSPASVK